MRSDDDRQGEQTKRSCSDYERQGAVEQAERGCIVAACVLVLAAVGAFAFSSIVTPILGALLVLSGIGLALVHWAARW